MSSGGLLLLMGLLTLWVELTPVSSLGGPAYCNLPPDSGSCKANFPAFYYDPASHKCQEFIYGGCDGNDNNFKSIDECQSTCAG
uniref:Kunitz/BPTI-like toxin transcript variant X1 n=1 Tax=Micrurus mipartitus TaxID=430902 RepID=A0AAU6NT03_MICMP